LRKQLYLNHHGVSLIANCDFCLSHGSVATVLSCSRQNYSDFKSSSVVSLHCMAK